MKMFRPILILLIAAYTVTGYVLSTSKPCTEEEMMKPLNAIHGLVEDMQSPEADTDSLKIKISQEYRDIHYHIEAINKKCGDEKTESVDKLNNFLDQIQMLEEITSAMDYEDKQKAKELLEDIYSEYTMQIFMRKYGTDIEKIEKIIEVIQMFDNMKFINMMNEALTYVIDESNLNISMKFQNVMKEQIIANKDKVEPEVILAAKMNMKEIAKKNLPDCFCGVKALRGLDSKMADQAGYEAAFQTLNDNIYSPAFKIATTAPCAHMQGICLGAIFDKIAVLELHNSMVAAKTLVLAKKLLASEAIKKYVKAQGILKNIIDNSSTVAQNLASGYSCQDDVEMTDIIEQEKHNEYMVFYDPEEPKKLSARKYNELLDGDKLKITIDTQHNTKTVRYSILMDNADYPDNLQIKGNIVSKRTIGQEIINTEDICGMNPKPEPDICIPFSELLTWSIEEAPKKRADLYELKVCN